MKPIILKLKIRRGFSFFPFIVIPKRVVGTIHEIPYIDHETTHWDRQGTFVFSWLFKYITDNQFRIQEETIAYANEIRSYIEHDPNSNLDLLIEQKARSMVNGYKNMCTFDEAVLALRKTLGG